MTTLKQLNEAKSPLVELKNEQEDVGRFLETFGGSLKHKLVPSDPTHPVVKKRLAWIKKFHKRIIKDEKEMWDLFFKQRAF